VYQAYLGFPTEGMLYFEDVRTQDGLRLVQVTFDSVGPGLRRHLVGPVDRSKRWDEFCSIVGSESTYGTG
jgi:hypothetical protein